jgi:hypothetical protein
MFVFVLGGEHSGVNLVKISEVHQRVQDLRGYDDGSVWGLFPLFVVDGATRPQV